MSLLTAATLLPLAVHALDNGFGRTPIMGYNSYNDIGCSPNSTYMERTMRAIKDKGLADLGYKFFQVDCGWQGYDRQANGSITYDASVFPNGIRPLADIAISLGLKWSMYTDQGVYSCDTKFDRPRPGSLGFERQDALQFAGWNVDYIKVDNCFVDPPNNAPKDPRSDFPSRYGAISTALQNAGIKGINICQWGVPQIDSSGLIGPSTWAPPISTSYRISDDIARGWANVARIYNQAIHSGLLGLSAPGRFADMDMLEVGNPGMTVDEQTTHFAIWALFKSHLILGTSIVNISPTTLSIITNRDLLAINQDPLGLPVKLIQRFTNDYDVFLGPLQNNDRAVLIVDQSNRARTLSLPFSLLNIQSATAKDIYTGTTTTGASSFSKSLPAHGSIVLRLSSIRDAPAPTTTKTTYYPFPAGRLAGGANIQTCAGCSSGQKVGNIGSGATVTLGGIRATAGTMDVLFDYVNCEIGYLGDQGPNLRGASVSVNGGQAVTVTFPLTGYNWEKDLVKGYKVRLSGFNVGGENTVTVGAATGVTAWAPDLDRVGVVG